MKALDWISRRYDERALRFGRNIRSCDYSCKGSFLQRQRTVLKLLGQPKNKKILDVGCGPGLFLEALSPSNSLVGLDLSIEMLHLARRNLTAVRGDGEHLPFEDRSFDIVLAIETLQHLTDPGIFLKELLRVLRQGGELVLSAINESSFLHRAFRILGGYENLYFHPLQSIYCLLEREGMGLLDVKFLGFPFPWVWEPSGMNGFSSSFASSWVLRCTKNSGLENTREEVRE